jgi:hypothetical protein
VKGGADTRLLVGLRFSSVFGDMYSRNTPENVGLARRNSKIGSRTTLASIGLTETVFEYSVCDDKTNALVLEELPRRVNRG